MNLEADAAQRFATYQRLQRRNRIVAILRIGVPALGAILLVSLVGQIYMSSLANRFGVGRISVSPDAVTVETPQYSGVLDDGGTYRVTAAAAEAAVDATDRIAMVDASLTLKRSNGVTIDVKAPAAMLDTTREIVTIDGIAYIVDSTGTAGTIRQSIFDYVSQTLVSEGPVHIDYADGTALDGIGMTYDAIGMVWTFSNANVTLPSTPGDQPSETATP